MTFFDKKQEITTKVTYIMRIAYEKFKKQIIVKHVLLFKNPAYIYVGVCTKGRKMMFHLLEKAIIGMALAEAIAIYALVLVFMGK